MKSKEYRIVGYAGMFYVVIIFYILAKNYLEMQLRITFEAVYGIFTQYALLAVAYLLMGLLLCGICSCAKKHLILELVIIEIPIVFMLLGSLYYCFFPSSGVMYNAIVTGELLPPGALLLGVEAVRFWRLRSGK